MASYYCHHLHVLALTLVERPFHMNMRSRSDIQEELLNHLAILEQGVVEEETPADIILSQGPRLKNHCGCSHWGEFSQNSCKWVHTAREAIFVDRVNVDFIWEIAECQKDWPCMTRALAVGHIWYSSLPQDQISNKRIFPVTNVTYLLPEGPMHDVGLPCQIMNKLAPQLPSQSCTMSLLVTKWWFQVVKAVNTCLESC